MTTTKNLSQNDIKSAIAFYVEHLYDVPVDATQIRFNYDAGTNAPNDYGTGVTAKVEMKG
jgi:hypothetical protein